METFFVSCYKFTNPDLFIMTITAQPQKQIQKRRLNIAKKESLLYKGDSPLSNVP